MVIIMMVIDHQCKYSLPLLVYEITEITKLKLGKKADELYF